MLYDRIYEIVGNEEKANAIMDIIRPLKRAQIIAAEQLATICNCCNDCILGKFIKCPFSGKECHEITARDWAFFIRKQVDKETKANAS